jgi:hypothetical protein
MRYDDDGLPVFEEIQDADVRAVAAVDRPATGRRWRWFKGLPRAHRHAVRADGLDELTGPPIAAGGGGGSHVHEITAGGRTLRTDVSPDTPLHQHVIPLGALTALRTGTALPEAEALAKRLDDADRVLAALAAAARAGARFKFAEASGSMSLGEVGRQASEACQQREQERSIQVKHAPGATPIERMRSEQLRERHVVEREERRQEDARAAARSVWLQQVRWS